MTLTLRAQGSALRLMEGNMSIKLKQSITVFLSVILALLCSTTYADTERYNISQLGDLCADGWHDIYQAYGRTIQVDLEIEVPAVDKAPVILVEEMPPLPEQRQRELKEKYLNVKDDNPINGHDFRSDEWSTVLEYKLPYRLNEKAGETMLTVTWPRRAFTEYDWSKAYADNNPLTLEDAFDIVNRHFHDVFPDIDLMVKDIALEDRYLDKKTGKPIRDMGGYLMMCKQLFHGIPQITSAHRTFRASVNNETDGEILFSVDYETRATIVAEDAYTLNCKLIREKELLHEDIPLLPFSEIKPNIVDLIKKGNVRNVYKVQLAYVVFDNPDDLNNSFVLLPCWVAWCEYYKDAKTEMNEFQTNEPFFETSYYKPIIINAQTGILLNPESKDPLRSRCPEIITW